MKLSKLVALREHLIGIYSTEPVANCVSQLHNQLTNISADCEDTDLQQRVSTLSAGLTRINESVYASNTEHSRLVQEINRRIFEVSKKFFSENYTVELSYNNVTNARQVRVIPLSTELEDEILNRIRLYTDWKYPALEIGCRDGEWTKHLVAADPLYIVDFFPDFTESATKDFTEEYKRRIRVYLCKDHDLSVLPQQQFGFIFSWNHINYLSLDTVKQYLRAAWELMRPGGTFMFSYNNGDTEAGAGYAESYFMSYIPKSMLIPLCESIGFEIVYTRDIMESMAISWIEIRKPGELKTVKAHQVLGELKRVTY